MSRKGRWPGTWRVICDSCGFEYPSDQVRERWDGFIVCEKDYETKHPQLDIKIRVEINHLPFVRPEPEPTFLELCTVVSSSCYAGLGTAGCMLAGNQQFTYDTLLDLNGGVLSS